MCMPDPVFSQLQCDALQSLANQGMGQAATRLSGLLDSFIKVSVPHVRVVAVRDVAQALREMTGVDGPVTAVRQGFRSEFKGEALVICRSGEVTALGALIGGRHAMLACEAVSDEELIFDVTNALTGACVSSMLDQLGLSPVFTQPGLLGEHVMLDEVFQQAVTDPDLALLVEVNFVLEARRIRTHLVMLMAEDSLGHVGRAIDSLLQSTP
jgi:chemotaxis protein CheC